MKQKYWVKNKQVNFEVSKLRGGGGVRVDPGDPPGSARGCFYHFPMSGVGLTKGDSMADTGFPRRVRGANLLFGQKKVGSRGGGLK